MVKITLDKNTATVDDNDNEFLAKLLLGTKRKININTPFGKRKVKVVKKS